MSQLSVLSYFQTTNVSQIPWDEIQASHRKGFWGGYLVMTTLKASPVAIPIPYRSARKILEAGQGRLNVTEEWA